MGIHQDINLVLGLYQIALFVENVHVHVFAPKFSSLHVFVRCNPIHLNVVITLSASV
jgi:hypothetical protein